MYFFHFSFLTVFLHSWSYSPIQYREKASRWILLMTLMKEYTFNIRLISVVWIDFQMLLPFPSNVFNIVKMVKGSLFFLILLLLCWVRVHCEIYKRLFWKEQNTSFFFPHIFSYFYSFIHMCINCLGHCSLLPPPPPPTAWPASFQAEPVLPLSLILLKGRHKHNKKYKVFLIVEIRIAIQRDS
jgi:hypothetical protein